MRKLLLLLSAVACLVVLTSPAVAQETETASQNPPPPAPTSSKIISGTILSTGNSSLVVKNATGASFTFDVDGATTLPEQIKQGDRVNVEFESKEGGHLHALRVTMQTEDPPAVSAGGPTAPPDRDSVAPAPDGAKKMPRTASPLPLIALAGTLSLVAGLAFRMASRARV